MKFHICVLGCIIAVSLAFASQSASAASVDDAELSALKAEIEAMKRDYETRMRALEERLQAAEMRASEGETIAAGDAEGGRPEEPAAPTEAAVETEVSVTEAEPQSATIMEKASYAWSQFSRTFNPAIGAVLQGRVAYLQGWEGERYMPGYPIGGQRDRGREGISLGESELIFSANVDDKLYGFLDVAFDQDDIGIEEGYFSTLSLPLGLGVKGGKFLSSIGYHNERHPHTWDFVDAPLVYEGMLGGSYSDPGLHVTWIAPTDLYLELGSEIFRGDAFPAAGAANHGFGTVTAFAKASGDVGNSSTWKVGVSYLRSESDGRKSEYGDDITASFDGATNLVIADFVWKWAPLGNFRQRNFTFQTEYMYRNEHGDLVSGVGDGDYRSNQNGFYVQGVYQFVPRWRVGLRYGQLWGDNRVSGLPPDSFFNWGGSSPRRVSTMLDWSNSEFSRFRLQYSHESGGLGDDSSVFLQYIISIGAHGAHSF